MEFIELCFYIKKEALNQYKSKINGVCYSLGRYYDQQMKEQIMPRLPQPRQSAIEDWRSYCMSFNRDQLNYVQRRKFKLAQIKGLALFLLMRIVLYFFHYF